MLHTLHLTFLIVHHFCSMMKLANSENTAVIIPVYNAERHLNELLTRVSAIIPVSNIITIDDCSTDNSGRICREFGTVYNRFSINCGKGVALKHGFETARKHGFDFAVTLDSDLQHLPEEIPDFLEEQNVSNADMVIGCRIFHPSFMPIPRIASNVLTSFIVSLVTKKKIKDSQSGFRLYRLEKVIQDDCISDRYQYETEIIFSFARQNAVFSSISIPTIYHDEESYIRHGRDIMNFIKIVFNEIFVN